MRRLTYTINYLWRLMATALAFSSFTIGAILLSYCILPIAKLTVRDTTRSKLRCQFIVNRTFRFFTYYLHYAGILHLDVIDLTTLRNDQGCIIVSNHPSLLDIVLLLGLLNQCNVIVKQKIANSFITKQIVKATGYITNAPSEVMNQQLMRALHSGNNFIIFPEGTRTTPGQPLQLQRGAANLAIRTPAPMRLVHINCSQSGLTKTDKWYQIPPNRICYQIRVGEKINPDQFLADNNAIPSRAARSLTRYLAENLDPERSLK